MPHSAAWKPRGPAGRRRRWAEEQYWRTKPTVPAAELWPVLAPVVLVLALAALWTGLWFYAAASAEASLAGWREREAKVGRIYVCEQQTISGFPFRIEVHCADPGMELRHDDPPLALKAVDLQVVAQVFEPTLLIGELSGPMTIAEPGRPPSYIANWTNGQSSVRGTPAAPERVSIVVDRLAVDRTGDGGPATVLKADRIALDGRMVEGSAAGNPVIELALRLDAATAPELHSFTAQPIDADVAATLRGLADFSPKPWPVRFKELQARGGNIEITRGRIQQGNSVTVSSGTLGLTARGGLDGQIQVTIAGLETIVKALDIERAVSTGSMGATINALDRIIPGLGQIARQNAAPGAVAALRAIGKATTLEGKPAIALPLRFSDGQVLLGPFPVGRIPLLF